MTGVLPTQKAWQRVRGSVRYTEQVTRTKPIPGGPRRPRVEGQTAHFKAYRAVSNFNITPNETILWTVRIFDDTGDTGETMQGRYWWFSDGETIASGKRLLLVDFGDDTLEITPLECE